MKFRALPLLNAIGCLALIGLIGIQWLRERATLADLGTLRAELATATARTTAECDRRSALERDLAVLKEAIDATQRAAEATARQLTEQTALTTAVQAELSAASAQVAAWETALKARDERLLTLDADLSATRQRLAEAIAKLKAAASR